MQLDLLINEFLENGATERRLSPHTLDAYSADLADFGRWLSTVPDVAAVTPTELRQYLQWMVGERRLSVATVRRRLACLRSFFRFLGREHAEPNPFGTWKPVLPRRKQLPRALSRAEAASLVSVYSVVTVKAQDANFLEVALPLLIATGVRVGELCHIVVDDVSPDGSAVRIHGKGSRDRIAYVSDAELRRQLAALVACRRKESAASRALFLNRHGNPLRPQSVRARLRKHAASVGLARRVTPHMLRHTAATLLMESGVDIRFVQRLLGHSSIATTEIYTHVSDESLRSTLARAGILRSLAAN